MWSSANRCWRRWSRGWIGFTATVRPNEARPARFRPNGSSSCATVIAASPASR